MHQINNAHSVVVSIEMEVGYRLTVVCRNEEVTPLPSGGFVLASLGGGQTLRNSIISFVTANDRDR